MEIVKITATRNEISKLYYVKIYHVKQGEDFLQNMYLITEVQYWQMAYNKKEIKNENNYTITLI